ncbi:MAG: SGNH/GDSL hydrolase family protein [Clostridia bacterium]|nr:SGNH/GDSL hydrolase family protein [Clostridia bacterium]
MRIEEIDRNMAVTTRLDDPDIQWHDVHDAPFSIHGFTEPQPKGDVFRRLPEDVAKATSDGVYSLSFNTAGGRVRFVTDSPYVAIHAEMESVCRMDHMAFTGIHGFDLYARIDGQEKYVGTFRPSTTLAHGYESKLALPAGGPHEVTVNFPLYNNVDRLFIGVQEGSHISAPRAYAHPVPVVYYGSSITQGGCASRPGNSYQAMITRMLDCDHINLGFSGSAKAEPAIVEYMSGLEMSAFVCDYDHNAPTAEHLRATHLPLYRAVRAKQPGLPIILISKPDHQTDLETLERFEIIRATYETAIAEGDRNITLIDGRTLFDGEMADSCTVDTCHPNDLGFYRMAQKIAPVIEGALNR